MDAVHKGIQNPDDTKQAARMVEAVQGRAPLRMLRRVRRNPLGRKLLAEKPDLLAALQDAQWLASLPEGTLGRSYYEFCRREKLTPGGLYKAVEDGFDRERFEMLGEDEKFLQMWMRDTHDLFHVVTGYQTDLLGEISVLAFSAVQTRNPGVWFMVLAGACILAQRRMINPTLLMGALRMGIRARNVVVTDWKGMLSLPLEEVRNRLNITPAPAYVPLYTSLVRMEVA
ncbi:MAG: hypothetical protein KIT79_08175 [Deltaproteobacteria bacterium]|nr:hypothetical protein [Deltaproteobacteria bacterium]